MLAMRVHAPAPVETYPLRADDVPVPRPGPGELLVRVLACGVCRTDLHVIEGDLPFPGRPVVPGHQVVGRVEGRGPGVEGFADGERVGIAWLRGTCGACAFCRAGRENLCEHARFTGWQEDGGYAEHAVVPADFAYRVPDAFDDAEATPLLCAGIIGYRALRRSGARPGQRLAIYGFGSSAHVTLQVARHRGIEVLVATRGEEHRALARELGAAWVGEADEPLPEKADAAILFAPAGSLVPVALRSLQKGGTLALAGIHLSDVPAMSYEPHLFYEKSLCSVTANTREDGRELLREAADIPIRPRVERFPLRDANRALQKLKSDGIRGSGVLVP